MAILKIEVANDPKSLSYGLMFRKNLPKDQGMLFKFPSIIEATFWGKNTYIPLDVAFIDRDNKIIDIKNITPMSTKPVRSSGLCTMALEANSGFFRSNNIKSGASIEIVLGSDGLEKEIHFRDA